MSIGTALALIFLTPLGWIGLIIFGVSIAIIVDATRGGSDG